MTTATWIIVAFLACCAVAIGYWLRQAWLAAERVRKAFDPYPQAPACRDVRSLTHARTDADIEAEWRRRVAKNVARRAEQDAEPMPVFLVKQAD